MIEARTEYLTQLFQQIAVIIQRPYQELLRFQSILKDNWYDSQQALAQMTDADFQALSIPRRIWTTIRKLTGESIPPKTTNPTEIHTEQSDYIQIEQNFLEGLKEDTMSNRGRMLQILELMDAIISKCIENPYVDKYRRIKITNKRFAETIGPSLTASNFMEFIGFLKHGEELVMDSFDLKHLDKCKGIVERTQIVVSSMPDPYQSSLYVSEQKTNAETLEVAYQKIMDTLNHIRRQSLEVKSINRKPRVYHKLQQDKLHQHPPSFGQFLLLAQNPQHAQILRTIEQAQLTPVRKAQIQMFLSQRHQPCMRIKIKLPTQQILQGQFSPLQKIKDIYQFVQKCGQGPFYLHTRYPVTRMDKSLDKLIEDVIPDGELCLGSDLVYQLLVQ